MKKRRKKKPAAEACNSSYSGDGINTTKFKKHINKIKSMKRADGVT
jgi:hypothetical protein